VVAAGNAGNVLGTALTNQSQPHLKTLVAFPIMAQVVDGQLEVLSLMGN
jgi:hypothetical protein